eukprot:TRINITY_DN30700_c0_g1_i2.p1 TRINITY_DN30700_c0_g1~~TRINITY_DN30700_c0_g1_i2.p1  ORF type:complete len:785 (-),score=201.38 TRINITY_DN30700_c0_g1_i2:101-2455(-)
MQARKRLSHDGAALRDFGAELRPAIVRLVRAENKDGPACGLGGNENDARYTYLREHVLAHLNRALNRDVDKHRRLRDKQIWQNPTLLGAENAQDPDACDSEEKRQEQDAMLTRLAFEYELLGNVSRARELYEERLALEQNKENGEAVYGFARFLMRCGQNQMDAERLLRYAISLRPEDEGPSFKEVAFLACLLQNHRQPCSLDAGGEKSARFDAALALMEDYADRHAEERLPLYFLFLIYAIEAFGLRAEMEVSSGEAAPELSEHCERLSAEAAKYLELSRAPASLFSGTLNRAAGMPSFPELEELVQRERINRGEAIEVPQTKPAAPAAWQPPAQPAFPAPDAMRRLPDTADATALECIDLLLHCGLPDLVRFLLQEAVETYGFLSPVTAASERCKIQLIKAAMLAEDWSEAESLVAQLFSFRGGDRLPEAHALLGECRFRAARSSGASSEGYATALSAFEEALQFMDPAEASLEPLEARPAPKEDPVLHLRVAKILHMRAEEAGFEDLSTADRAVYHYKRSLLAAPTADAWKNVGVCAYRRVRFAASTQQRERKLKEATKYLKEANVLDRDRPDILAWLAMCAVELGQVQVAKQGVRQLLQFEERLDIPTALELAKLLLRFSNEQQAHEWNGERGRLVQDGRYIDEAAAMARMVLSRSDNGEAKHVLAWSLALRGEHGPAATEFCAALPALALEDPSSLGMAAEMAQRCAAKVQGEPQLARTVEEAIAWAFEQQLSQGSTEMLQSNLAPMDGMAEAPLDATAAQDFDATTLAPAGGEPPQGD